MNRKSLPWSVKQACGMIKKGSIVFDSPIQRAAGQWKIENQSLLIDSILRTFVPDFYAVQTRSESGNTYSIIDGLQRLTTIFSYLNDEWELTQLNPIKLESTGESFDISGMKFSQLPEEVQEEIKSYTLTAKIIEIEEDEDEEEIVEEIFYRLNSGSPMAKEHLALISAGKNVQEFIRKVITEHPLFIDNLTKFSASAIKKSDREMTILQSILLLSGKDFSSFAAKDVEQFFSQNDITLETLEQTEKAFSDIAEAFPETNKFLIKINIPIMAYVFAHTQDKEQTITKLLEYVKDSKAGDKYKRHTGAGSVKKEKVQGRIKVLSDICGVKEQEEKGIKEIFEQANAQIEEETQEDTSEQQERHLALAK